MKEVSIVTTGKCEKMAPTGLPAGSAFEIKYGSKSTIFFAMSTYERSKWVNCIEHNVVIATGGYAAKKQREKEAAEVAREREVEAAKGGFAIPPRESTFHFSFTPSSVDAAAFATRQSKMLLTRRTSSS